jgi:hypothetical protein
MQKVIAKIDRERNSHVGNPRFRFTFTDGEVRKSKPNAGWAYAVGNSGMREGSTVEIELDGRNNIVSMEVQS